MSEGVTKVCILELPLFRKIINILNIEISVNEFQRCLLKMRQKFGDTEKARYMASQ